MKIKEAEPILVCLGNPPYGRHEAAESENKSLTGGWVRYGDLDDPEKKPILSDFIEPARKSGHGVHLKNLYNLYIYFIRWALWKVFEHKTATGPGVVTFITASSYLDGDAFAGVREHMRRICDFIDIIDLGGEGRGTRRDENVFAIQTPVAIFMGWRQRKSNVDVPAPVRYARIEGSREEKLAALDVITRGEDVRWETVLLEWQASFRPAAEGPFTKWPNVTDLFPWQNNGIKAGRTWVIGPSENILRERLLKLIEAPGNEKAELFKNSPTGRKFHESAYELPPGQKRMTALSEASNWKDIRIEQSSYRSFDRQYIVADPRFLDRPSPPLWSAHSDGQIYLVSLFSIPLDSGPALVASSNIPDLDYFRGSYGAKAVMPLYRTADRRAPNILPGLIELLSNKLDRSITPEDFAGYVYCLLAQPSYAAKFSDKLASKEVRVPLTKDKSLFTRASELGKELIWLHTYGERLPDAKHPPGQIPKGSARCERAVSGREDNYPNEFRFHEETNRLHVGDGIFAPVSKKIWEFEISGLKVVQSWLGYRMKDRAGRRSSPLDDIRPRVWSYEFTRELLELLWVLEHTINNHPEQRKIFEAVLASELFDQSELPEVPEESRKPPMLGRRAKAGQSKLDI